MAPKMKRFKKSLPRLTELHDRFVSDDGANFFRLFPTRLECEDTVTYNFYQTIEDWLTFIPPSEWDSYATKVGEVVEIRDLKCKRHWERLHDVFNESLGVKLLRTEFSCDQIRFLPRSRSPTPDLLGDSSSSRYYLEVKTINHSQDERESWYSGETLSHTVVIPNPLQRKITATYEEAVTQLRAPADASQARKIALLIINTDYNVDPMDEELEDLFLRFLDTIEQPDFHILARLQKS